MVWVVFLDPPPHAAVETLPRTTAAVIVGGLLHSNTAISSTWFVQTKPQIRGYEEETEFRVCVTAVALLRFLCEHLHRLPLGVITRVLDTHDVLLGLVVLVENPPWTRRTEEVGATRGSEECLGGGVHSC